MILSWSKQLLWKSLVEYACLFFEECKSWREQGQKERVGHLAQLISFFPVCLPFQCWSLKVFIRRKTSNSLPFRNYPEMSILLSVMFPSKTTSECKPQKPKVINVIAIENYWLNRSCFKAQNWLCFKIWLVFQCSHRLILLQKNGVQPGCYRPKDAKGFQHHSHCTC